MHAFNGRHALLVGGSERLLAAALRAHHVVPSVIGADRVPGGYFAAKLAQEAAVRAAGAPFTLLRATQFHPYVAGLLRRAARFGVLPVATAVTIPVSFILVVYIGCMLSAARTMPGRTRPIAVVAAVANLLILGYAGSSALPAIVVAGIAALTTG